MERALAFPLCGHPLAIPPVEHMFSLVAGFAYRPADPWGYTTFSLGTILQGGTAYWFLPVLVMFFVAAKMGLAYLVYGRGTELPVVTVMTITGLLAAIMLSVSASRFAPVRAASRYLAARTLPLYLLHPVLLAVSGGLAAFFGGGKSSIPQELDILNVVAVPVLFVVITAGSLVLYDWLLIPACDGCLNLHCAQHVVLPWTSNRRKSRAPGHRDTS